MKVIARFVCRLLLCLLIVGAPAALAGNVVFITVDGVRFQEFFGGVQKPALAGLPRGTRLFPALEADADRGGTWVFGDGKRTGMFRVADFSAVSLPGYRAMLSGEFEDRCWGNGCRNIDRETIFDGLARRGFARGSVAAFTSWEGLGRALESSPGGIVRDVGHGTYPTEGASAEERLAAGDIAAQDQSNLPPWGGRRDPYTYAAAKLYLEHHHPRFLYLSLGDTDEFAHLKQYRNYVDSLRRYDAWIVELRNLLLTMGDYGADTSIVLTTDHGRGAGAFWSFHNSLFSSAFRTWAAVIPSARLRMNGQIRPRVSRAYDQRDIRPTLETLLGVESDVTPLRTGQSLVLNKAHENSL